MIHEQSPVGHIKHGGVPASLRQLPLIHLASMSYCLNFNYIILVIEGVDGTVIANARAIEVFPLPFHGLMLDLPGNRFEPLKFSYYAFRTFLSNRSSPAIAASEYFN